ncbi:MAG: hypothetical protein QGG84_11820, partial [Rhodospirillales bacterium]|nr:hypothetical protein [Rhodospirillales bacterium]
ARNYWRRFLSVVEEHPRLSEVRRRMSEVEAQIETSRDQQPTAAAEPAPKPPTATIPEHNGAQNQEDVGQLNPFGLAIGKAMAAIKRKDSAGAEAAFREALKLRPNDVGTLAGLAETLYHQKKTLEAEETISAAYQRDMSNTQARWVYGLIMLKSGKNMEKALQAWEALNRDSPDFAAQVGVSKTLEAVKQMRQQR